MLRVANILLGTTVNGPGSRNLLHVQGCTLACPGCFNPHTHTAQGGELMTPVDALEALLAEPCDGVTISGGEPFQQNMGDMYLLLRNLRLRNVNSIIMYTGYTRRELDTLQGFPALAELGFIDALISGRYSEAKPNSASLRSSYNQQLILLTDRHTEEELDVPLAVEIITDKHGSMVLTGFPDAELLKEFKAA